MPSDPRVEVLLRAFEASLGRLSLGAVRDVSAWWEQVDKAGDVAARFGEVLVEPWDRGAVLGVAFYRLLRALQTGRTVPSPVRGHAQGGVVTFGDLVREFNEAAGLNALSASSLAGVRVQVDKQVTPDLAALRDVDVRAAQALLRARLDAGEVSSGVVAGVGQQAAAGGARSVVRDMGDRDPARQAWIRVSGTGTPCAFCAMLLSRGAVYSGKHEALRHDVAHPNGTHGYHPNCHCYALPLFAGASIEGSRFAVNREMQDLWYNDFGGKGFNGKSGWRSYYYRKFKR
nr:MAG TPA: minor capsid protein [Caudoviricetes sp.]